MTSPLKGFPRPEGLSISDWQASIVLVTSRGCNNEKRVIIMDVMRAALHTMMGEVLA